MIRHRRYSLKRNEFWLRTGNRAAARPLNQVRPIPFPSLCRRLSPAHDTTRMRRPPTNISYRSNNTCSTFIRRLACVATAVATALYLFEGSGPANKEYIINFFMPPALPDTNNQGGRGESGSGGGLVVGAAAALATEEALPPPSTRSTSTNGIRK
jgi:hypothetical protein